MPRRLVLALLLLLVATLGGVPTGCSFVMTGRDYERSCLEENEPCYKEEGDCCPGYCCMRESGLAGLLGEKYCRELPEKFIDGLLNCE